MGVMAYSELGVEVNMLMLQQINFVLWQIIFAWLAHLPFTYF